MSNKYNSPDTNSSFKKNANERERTVRTNYNIRNAYCRVIENGKAPSIMKTSDAVKYAKSLGLDLVEIGYDKANNCSNCKVCDYSKFIYEQKKREKEAKKQARANKVDVKSVQMTLTTDVADKDRMIKHAKEFLEAGDKVKIAIRFRNRRETENIDLAKNLMKEVLTAFNGIAIIDSVPTLNGKELACILRRA